MTSTASARLHGGASHHARSVSASKLAHNLTGAGAAVVAGLSVIAQVMEQVS